MGAHRRLMSSTASCLPSPQRCPRTLIATIPASNPGLMAHTRYHPAVALVGAMRPCQMVVLWDQGQRRVFRIHSAPKLNHLLPDGLSKAEHISTQLPAGQWTIPLCTTHTPRRILFTTIWARIQSLLHHLHPAGTIGPLNTPTFSSEAHRHRRNYQYYHRHQDSYLTQFLFNLSGRAMVEG
jgi:hypothetical protein